jgi:hypothetical protein
VWAGGRDTVPTTRCLSARGIKLSLGGQVYDPTDPMGKMFFNILATFAEFEVDLLRMRTREGMAVARAKGRLKGRRPKLSTKQQTELPACTAPATTPSLTSPNCSTSPDPPSTALSQPWKLLLHNAAADNASSDFALTDRPPNEKGPDPLRY